MFDPRTARHQTVPEYSHRDDPQRFFLRPSRTLRNRLTRRTVSADRSHGSAHETRSLPESIVCLAALWCPLLSPRAPVTGTPGECLFASLPFNDRSLSMRSITIGASTPSRPRQTCHKQLSRRSLTFHTAQFAALNVPVPFSVSVEGRRQSDFGVPPARRRSVYHSDGTAISG